MRATLFLIVGALFFFFCFSVEPISFFRILIQTEKECISIDTYNHHPPVLLFSFKFTTCNHTQDQEVQEDAFMNFNRGCRV